jgi:hypothetical protein
MSGVRKPTWEIFRLAARAVYLGRVQAADERAALKAAVRDLGIKNAEQQRRLIVRRVS